MFAFPRELSSPVAVIVALCPVVAGSGLIRELSGQVSGPMVSPAAPRSIRKVASDSSLPLSEGGRAPGEDPPAVRGADLGPGVVARRRRGAEEPGDRAVQDVRADRGVVRAGRD